MWLVLLTMVGMACLPLVHNAVHHHHPVVAADAVGRQATAPGALQPDGPDHHADAHRALPDSQADDCAVCVHHDRSCPLVFVARVPMPVQARAPPAPPPLAASHWPSAAWALPASRAPPALRTTPSPRLA